MELVLIGPTHAVLLDVACVPSIDLATVRSGMPPRTSSAIPCARV